MRYSSYIHTQICKLILVTLISNCTATMISFSQYLTSFWHFWLNEIKCKFVFTDIVGHVPISIDSEQFGFTVTEQAMEGTVLYMQMVWCMYASMFVCVFHCHYVCVCVCARAHVHACVHACACVCLHARVCVCTTLP